MITLKGHEVQERVLLSTFKLISFPEPLHFMLLTNENKSSANKVGVTCDFEHALEIERHARTSTLFLIRKP